jgi:diguanylate cyclase (GGDEF)-like protein
VNVSSPASLNRNLESGVRVSPLRKIAAYGKRRWSRAAAWQQALAIALATMLGLQLFMRLMTVITVSDRGWIVCWRLCGVTAACMLRTRRRRWPWILLGLVLSLLWTGFQIHAPAPDTAISIAANLLEVCIAAFFLPPFTSVSQWIRAPHISWRFIIFALVLAPMAGAIVASGYFARQNHSSYMQSALFWWLGDSLGMVLWLPMTLVATTPELYALFRWNKLPRTLGLLGLMTGLSWLAFLTRSASLAFTILPVLLWIGLRLGFTGSVLATNMLALISTAGTLTGHGPFILMENNPDLQIRALQIFLMAAMLMALPISVVLLEREAFANQLQDAYREMELQATVDPLTGVANRRRFDEALHREWQRAIRQRNPIALLMVDSDAFKDYNDFYGHQAGDEILRRIADAMRRVVHRPTDLVARYGGEEFSILLPGTDEAGTRHLAEDVRNAVLNEHVVHAKSASGFVTVSIGCWSVIPNTDSNPSMLIRQADAALYAAKQNGRNRVEYGFTPAANS